MENEAFQRATFRVYNDVRVSKLWQNETLFSNDMIAQSRVFNEPMFWSLSHTLLHNHKTNRKARQMNLSQVLLYVQYNELLSVQGLHAKLDGGGWSLHVTVSFPIPSSAQIFNMSVLDRTSKTFSLLTTAQHRNGPAGVLNIERSELRQ